MNQKKEQWSSVLYMLVTLSIPTIIEEVLATLIQYVDTAMVGQLGEQATASVSVSTTLLLRKNGISVFEVITRQKISPELMTEVFADLIRKRFVIVYLCEQEIAMATFVPGENEEEGKICATDFYSYDMSHMIEILDFEQDANKSVEEIHNRIMSVIRQQKKEIMIEKAFAGMHKSVQQEPDLEYEFSEENLEKIREDANFVQEQLRVDVKA